jgi:hypothetical protein
MGITRNLANFAPGPNTSGVVQSGFGGTGQATLTANAVILGNATGSVQTVASGTAGNVLTSNGTIWISQGVVPSGNVVGTTATQTLTNKRIDPRVDINTTASSVTPTIADFDMYVYTALASALDINAPVGTPVTGNKLMFRFKDNGTARALNWNAIFRAVGVTLPTTTTINKVTYVGCIYNATEDDWDVIAVTTQA